MTSGGDSTLIVMLPFFVALIGAIGTIFVRLLSHPRDRYYDAARRLQRHRWEAMEAHSSLTNFVAADGEGGTTEETITLETGENKSKGTIIRGTGEMPVKRDTKRDEGFALWNPPSHDTARWVIGGLLRSGTDSLPEWIDLDESDTLEDGIDLLTEPRRLYRRCRWSFRQSFWLFIGSWLPAIVAMVCVVFSHSKLFMTLSTVFLGIAVLAFFAAVYKSFQYWWCRKKLDLEIERAEMF